MLAVICAILLGYATFENELSKNYFNQEGGYSILIFICMSSVCLYCIKELHNLNFVRGFDDVKDLIRGTITVDKISNLIEAYHHFRKTPGIEIIAVKDVEKLFKL